MFAFKKRGHSVQKRENLFGIFLRLRFFLSKGGIMKNNYKGIFEENQAKKLKLEDE